MSKRPCSFLLRSVLVGVSLLGWVSCGGGGGGSSSKSESSFTITANPTSIQLTFTEGQAPTSAHITAVGSGTPPSTLYVGATLEGTGLSPVIPITITGMQADVLLTAASGLKAGTYSGRVNLIASSDPGGTQLVGGTPIHIAYTVVVKPGLRVSPSSLNLSCVGGQTVSDTLQIQLPEGVGSYTAQIISSSPWMTLGYPSPGVLSVTAGPTHSGTYSGTVEIAAGNQVIDVPITYTASIPPGGEQGLTASPGTLNFSSSENLVAPTQALTITLPTWAPTAPLQTSVAYQASATNWLTLSPTGNGFAVSASAKTLSQGTYSALISFSAAGSNLSVPVSFVVGPGLTVSPTAFTFQTVEHADAAVQSAAFGVLDWPSGNDIQATVNYGAGASGWLSVTHSASGFDLLASARTLSQGTYSATVVLTPPAPGTAIQIPVNVQVSAALAPLGDRSFQVGPETVQSDLAVSQPIQLMAGPSATWNATTTAPWIHLDQTSGSTGTALTYQVDLAALTALPNFSDQQGSITVQIPGTPITPVTFAVKLQKNLPEVRFLGPDLLVSGRSTRLTLRGKGFSALLDPVSRLSMPGLTPSNVQRISDTELALDATPAGDATLQVAITNGLGLDAGSATLRTVAPQTYAYAALPTNGDKRSILFDPVRQAVYATNQTAESLVRFRLRGGAWTTDAVSVPGIIDAGMSPGGASIMVTSSPGHLQLLDPDTLSPLFTLDFPGKFARSLSEGISTLNNGRSWLAVGSIPDELNYFDHLTRTILPREPQPELNAYFYDGPWMTASRNGSRMVVFQVNGTPAVASMSASDNLLQPAPGSNPPSSYWINLSDSGDRLLMNFYEVRDANWGLIGRITLPDSAYIGVAQAISPDGRRAYILGYRGDAMNAWSTTSVPRVFVFDSSTMSPITTDLPYLGQFDLADWPTCRTTDCNYRPRTTISPDGATLFFVGSVNLIVAPIPPDLR